MQVGHSELFKALEAGIFALSLMLLAIVQSPFYSAPTTEGVDAGRGAVQVSVQQ